MLRTWHALAGIASIALTAAFALAEERRNPPLHPPEVIPDSWHEPDSAPPPPETRRAPRVPRQRTGPPSAADREQRLDRLRDRIEDLKRQRHDLLDVQKLKEDDPRVREVTERLHRLEQELDACQRGPEFQPAPPPAVQQQEMDKIRERIERLTRQREELRRQEGHSQQELRQLTIDIDGFKHELEQMQRRRPPTPPMPPQLAPLMERLQHERPEVYERLIRLRSEHPDRFLHELLTLQLPTPPPPMEPGRMEDLRHRDPERFKLTQRDEELNRRAMETAERARNADDPQAREKLRQELRGILDQQFEVRMEIRRLELKELTQRVQELSTALDRRVKNKPDLVERRLRELLNPEEVGW